MRVRRRFRRRMRAGGLLVVLLCLSLVLVSCVAGSQVLWIRAMFGWDVSDYDAEPVESSLPPDDPIVELLTETMAPLLQDGARIASFHGSAEAVELHRDRILAWILSRSYATYAEAALSASGGQNCSILIPAEDFENAVFRHFGGLTVSHADGELFREASGGGYTAPAARRDDPARVTVHRLETTAHTWRLSFSLTDRYGTVSGYTAVFVRRADGSCYWNSLTRE